MCMPLVILACGSTPTVLPTDTQLPSDTLTPLPHTPSIELPTQTPYVITATTEIITPTSAPQGIFFLSLQDDAYFHLFAYSPQFMPLTRLTSDAWDDISPALSPNGNLLAFSSHQNGYWDLYIKDLLSGNLTRLTDTPEYDDAPSWSPDGAYIAFESYVNDNMDIYIHSTTNLGQAVIRLTQDVASDTSPAWSPLGRQIAFISNRSGEPEVWIADLDHTGNFIDVSNNPNMVESHPAWSTDGSKLTWAATDPNSGLTSLYSWDTQNPNTQMQWMGSGDWPIWLNNNNIASRLSAPNQTFLTGYSSSGIVCIPPFLLPGVINGLTYGVTNTAIEGIFTKATAPASSVSESGQELNPSSGRSSIIELSNVTATYPQLSELAISAFQKLRNRVKEEAGWDTLSYLENAYIPLTTTLDPGMDSDWLYTGRAFTLNPQLVQDNLMTVVREDFGQQVYWHIYLLTKAQDGSQGKPLTEVPWDFSSRATNSSAYESGGQLMKSIPKGYWLDLTTLALQYGWQRLPALTNWRTYYAGSLYNELAYTQGLEWQTAMLQLYPPEVLITPTLIIPPTRTPTRTPLWWRTSTPTQTATFHPTSTP
jgi:TolB protein